ncbi:MAG: universal stress protein [Deltaproteobacteria bacterium]|nr:universal stress protein [Deltaproteobacteria bacterium]
MHAYHGDHGAFSEHPRRHRLLRGFRARGRRGPLDRRGRRYPRHPASRGEHAGARVKTAVIRSNNPADTICEFATDQGVDLILMGTTGRAGLARFLIGSVAERVVRHAPCPVMVLR